MKRQFGILVMVLTTTVLLYSCGGGGGGSSPGGSVGQNSVVYAVRNTAPVGTCPNGGISVDAGIDTNSNGVLEPTEVTSTQYVCNGTNGTNGLTVLVSTVTEPAGAHCGNGGYKVNVGLDTNANGVLDSSEITSVDYICSGIAGPAMPVIQSLYLTGAPASPGGTITATVNAQSAQGLALTYSWSVTDGWTISSGGTTSVVTIAAPNGYTAVGTATVTVTDTQSRSAVGAVALSTVNDAAPVIESISIYPQPVKTSANLVASAFDQNGDGLTYSWTIGGISNILTGSGAIWNSPGIPGYYTVGLAVSDGSTTVNGAGSISIDSASPWPRFGRDIQGTRLSTIDTSANAGTVTKWAYTTGGPMSFSSPAIGADGTVYIGSGDGKLYAIKSNGDLSWSFQPGGVMSSPAIGADGTVYVGSSNSGLYAVNPDGSQKWNFPQGAVNSCPAIGADGTVYIGSGKLYAVNPGGTLKWVSTEGAITYSSPAIGADGTVYVGSQGGGYLYAFNPDGTVKWKYSIGGIVSYSSPAIGADGTVYIGSTSGNIYAINPNGSNKWTYPTGGSFVYSSPAIGADGTVYAGAFNGNIYAINPTGTIKWIYTTGTVVYSSPAIGADGTVYVGSSNNNLYAINANGTLKWSYATGGAVSSSPAIGADGTVYIGSDDAKLYAVK